MPIPEYARKEFYGLRSERTDAPREDDAPDRAEAEAPERGPLSVPPFAAPWFHLSRAAPGKFQ